MAVPPLVTTGTVIDSDWGNQVANALVNPFASSAARSSAITAPTTGQFTYVYSNDSSEGIECYSSAGAWRKPWNLTWPAWGIASYASDQTVSSTSYVDLTSLTVTASFVDNRWIKFIVSLELFQNLGTGLTFDIQVYDSTAGSAVLQLPSQIVNATDAMVYTAIGYYDAPASGSRTFKLIGKVSGSTVAVKGATAKSFFAVEDAGPSGAPA